MTEYNATLSGDELLNATISEVVETGNHALLTHLDYASSGHTGFQATIGDLADIRSGAALGATAVQPSAISDMATKTWTQSQGYGTYSKPSGGIPSSDMASSVQTSLGKADTALQEHQSLAGYATQTWVEGKGYLTEHQSLSAYRTSSAQDVIDATKQHVLTAGENITIVDNVISASGGGEAVWGAITGTLSNQTDLSTALENAKDVYVCEYNVTTFAQAQAAYNSGKKLVCKYRVQNSYLDVTMYLPQISEFNYLPAESLSYVFECANQEGSILYTGISSEGWGEVESVDLQTLNNLVTSVSSSSTDEQYPSAKLLYDQLLLKQDALTTSQLAAVNSGITSTDVTKLSTIESGAEVNVNADWNAASGDAQILNKPEIRNVPTSAVADAGKFLRVNASGAAEWQTVQDANGVSF